MDNLVKKWVKTLYNEEIDNATQAISNERLWLKGCSTATEQNSHMENIKRYEEYIETLEELKESFILKNGG